MKISKVKDNLGKQIKCQNKENDSLNSSLCQDNKFVKKDTNKDQELQNLPAKPRQKNYTKNIEIDENRISEVALILQKMGEYLVLKMTMSDILAEQNE